MSRRPAGGPNQPHYFHTIAHHHNGHPHYPQVYILPILPPPSPANYQSSSTITGRIAYPGGYNGAIPESPVIAHNGHPVNFNPQPQSPHIQVHQAYNFQRDQTPKMVSTPVHSQGHYTPVQSHRILAKQSSLEVPHPIESPLKAHWPPESNSLNLPCTPFVPAKDHWPGPDDSPSNPAHERMMHPGVHPQFFQHAAYSHSPANHYGHR